MQYSNTEKMTVLGKQQLGIQDLMILHDCGWSTAKKKLLDYMDEMTEKTGKPFLNRKVATKKYIQHIDYDEARVIRYAKLEQKEKDTQLAGKSVLY